MDRPISTQRGMRCTPTLIALAGLAALAGVTLGGCFSAGEWPRKEGSGLSLANPNHSPNDVIIVEALRFLVRMDYPDGVDEPIAINLPEGITDRVYQRLVERIDENAHPVSPETEGYPTYHLVSFSVLGDRAGVDLLRPAPEIGVKPNGEAVYQAYYMTVEGGLQPWKVTWAQARPVDALSPPALHYIDQTRLAAEPGDPADPAGAGEDAGEDAGEAIETAGVEDGS